MKKKTSKNEIKKLKKKDKFGLMNTQFVSHVVDENIDGSREGEKGECGGSR